MSGPPQLQSLVREPPVESDDASLFERVGFIATGGLCAAVVASLPVAFRTGSEGTLGLVLERWLALSAVTVPIAVATVAIVQRARIGLRMVVGQRRAPLALGVLWWALIQMGLLSVFAAVLRKTTHHHALAGVTFALFAVVTGVVVALFAARSTSLLSRGGETAQKLGLRLAAGCACLVVLLVGLRTSRAEGLHTTAAIADGFAFIVTTMFASSGWIRRFKRMPVVGLPLVGMVIVIGLITLRFDPDVQKSLEETAPMYMLVSSVFGG